MVAILDRSGPNNEQVFRLRFGGGVNSRASPADIDAMECSEGENFLLDFRNNGLRNRPPFDLVATAPNSGRINGFASLLTPDGLVSLLVQADNDVYDWDGATGFTDVGDVNPGARLRGRLEANFNPTNQVIITDLALIDPVFTWDGLNFEEMPHNLNGQLKAKYCTVMKERAWFGNVHDNGTDTPHMLLASKFNDPGVLSDSAEAPASAAGDSDPVFILAPDLHPINGLVGAFGVLVVSTDEGSMFKVLNRVSSQLSIDEFYPRSGAQGDESVVFIGNDVAFGRRGAIETLSDTDQFGDVQVDDLSSPIFDQLTTVNNWVNVYNSRTFTGYFFPRGKSETHVLHKPLVATDLSPWSKMTTQHALAMRPTAVMNALDPLDGLEYVFMGDESGNIYRMEGTGVSGDGGSANIKTTRLSPLLEMPLNEQAYDITGWVRYKKQDVAATLTLTFEHNGMSVFDGTITIPIPARDLGSVYKGSAGAGAAVYYKGSAGVADSAYYGGRFQKRLNRFPWAAPGQSEEFQVRVEVEGTGDLDLDEVGIRMAAAA
jgi:hypothetical protein